MHIVFEGTANSPNPCWFHEVYGKYQAYLLAEVGCVAALAQPTLTAESNLHRFHPPYTALTLCKNLGDS